ncbi:hypothetical protein ACFVU3_13730 [Streptomyces sp. NPDC058052]|uniref:hypothetical protein n=1 Tax=Streptomyces sp. NPDC058052 TaxID=3346316 RepID=UPI0036E97671
MSASPTPVHSIDATTAALQQELPQLEQLQQELEKELAAVSERVLSVRTALSALLTLAETPAPRAAQTAQVAPEPAAVEDVTAVDPAEAVTPQEAGPVPAPRKAATTRAAGGRKTAPAKAESRKERSSAKKPRVTASASKAAPAAKDPGGFTEQVIAVLARSPETPMRARDVAQALGRDSSTGAVNAVRSTLDRLVGTSRAARAGRGLYQAAGLAVPVGAAGRG